MVSFLKHLRNLRDKPEPTRQLVAFWGSLLLTLLIFGIWLAGGRLQRPPPAAPASASRSLLKERTDGAILRIREGWRILFK